MSWRPLIANGGHLQRSALMFGTGNSLPKDFYSPRTNLTSILMYLLAMVKGEESGRAGNSPMHGVPKGQ